MTALAAPVHLRRAAGVRVPPHERLVLGNGATITILPRDDVPLVAFHAVLRGGARGDPPERPGVATLTAGLLDKGAGERDGFAFAEAVERAGGHFSALAAAEHLSLSGQFLATHQEGMLGLLADALIDSHFGASPLEALKRRHIELIKAAKDSDPQELLAAYGRAFLFGGHAFGRPISGSEQSLAAITRADVLHYARQQLGADRLALVFTGAVDHGWLRVAATRAFAEWRRAAAPATRLSPPPPATRRVLLVDAPGATQSHFWIGGRGVSKHDPRRAALDLANAVYGGRFTSMLNTELRIRSGLSYGAYSSFTRGSVPGEFALRALARTDKTARAIELTLGTLERLKRVGLTQGMLDSARAYLLGQHPLSFETAADWAAALAELEIYGLGTEYIETYAAGLRAVTLEHAHEALAAGIPDPEATVIVVIGDAARIRGSLARFGPVSELPLGEPHFSAPAPRNAPARGRVRARVKAART
jgi:zinc protease